MFWSCLFGVGGWECAEIPLKSVLFHSHIITVTGVGMVATVDAAAQSCTVFFRAALLQ